MKYETGYRLFDDTYLCVFDECLAIAKVNKKGEIVKVITFGEKKGADNEDHIFKPQRF